MQAAFDTTGPNVQGATVLEGVQVIGLQSNCLFETAIGLFDLAGYSAVNCPSYSTRWESSVAD